MVDALVSGASVITTCEFESHLAHYEVVLVAASYFLEETGAIRQLSCCFLFGKVYDRHQKHSDNRAR